MIAVRIVVGVLAVIGVGVVLGSVLRTVVLPRGIPARLARVAFLSVRGVLRLRLRLTGRSDYATRDRVFALQAPFGLFAQLVVWASLIWGLFAVIFWSLSASTIDGTSVSRALEQSGSSMLMLGFDAPRGLARQLTALSRPNALPAARLLRDADGNQGLRGRTCAFAREEEPGVPPPDDRSVTNPIVPAPRAG